MTAEKALVTQWERRSGCVTQEDDRQFARDLARKRARFPFPNDFTELVRPLRDRLVEKHDRQSAEGSALRSLREIRVTASPSWDDTGIEVFFWFIREADSTSAGRTWGDYLERWLGLMPPPGRYAVVEGVVITLDEMSALEYVESDRLDLDHLSRAGIGGSGEETQ